MNTWVIIPAKNEAKNIADVVIKVKKIVDKVVVVDDGSDDDTANLATSAGAIVLQHLVNRGYGAALVTGSDYAVSRGADIIIHFDADGQFEANDISRLVGALQLGVPSVALGSRFLGKVIDMPKLRYLTLKLAIIFTWIFSGIKLTDAHNGFRAFTSSAWQKFNFRQDLMAFSSEVIDEIKRCNITWVEVPVTVRYTESSLKGSKQGKWPAAKIVKDLVVGRMFK